MIYFELILKYIKYIGIAVLLMAIIWFYKDYEYQKAENIRQTENASQLRKSDSLHFTSQILTSNELKDYLEYDNKDLKNKFANAKININRIESLVSSYYKYRDTSRQETDVTGLVAAIKNSIPKEQSWTDTTKCMTTKGIVSFDGQKLKVVVNDREFKNKSDAVVYWERRQWSFLGIETRLFGRKEFTSNSFDECGESKTMKLEKKK